MAGYVVPPGGGRSFGPGISLKVEHGVSPSFAVMESTLPPSWPGPGLHLHRAFDEAVYVLDGTVAFTLDGEEHACPAGSLVFVPRGASHGVREPVCRSRPDPCRSDTGCHPHGRRTLFQLEWAGQTGVEAGLEHAAVDPAAVAALYARYD